MDILQCEGRHFRPASVNSLGSVWDFFPPFEPKSAVIAPTPAYGSMPQNSALGAASMAEEADGQDGA